jgi:hypothetical protein
MPGDGQNRNVKQFCALRNCLNVQNLWGSTETVNVTSHVVFNVFTDEDAKLPTV